jgi:hypothetical protein
MREQQADTARKARSPGRRERVGKEREREREGEKEREGETERQRDRERDRERQRERERIVRACVRERGGGERVSPRLAVARPLLRQGLLQLLHRGARKT